MSDTKVTLPYSYRLEQPLLSDDKPTSHSFEHSDRPKYRKRFYVIISIGFFFLIITLFSIASCNSGNNFRNSKHPVMSQSPPAGWHTRAAPHPSKSSFEPSADNLQFGVIRSTPVNPSQLVAAFFAPDFVVDAAGRVLQLSSSDRAPMTSLVAKALSDDIPKPGGFRNQWRVHHARTSMPIHWLKDTARGDVSVYGWSSETRELQKSVQGITVLPVILQDAFGVFEEGRTDQSGGKGSTELAEQVAEIVTQA